MPAKLIMVDAFGKWCYTCIMEKRRGNKIDAITGIYWKSQIESGVSWLESKLHHKGDKIVQRYRNENDGKSYDVLYSNTETLAPVIFNSAPIAEVRANDSKSIAQRKSAEMIEETVNYFIDGKFESKARDVVNDFLLPGMGILRPRYESLIADKELDEETVVQEVLFEKVCFDYVNWKDLIFPEAPCWEDLPWIAFRSHMTYDEVYDMFGEEKASTLKYAPQIIGNKYKDKSQEATQLNVAVVYEVWDKHFKEQLFVSNDKILEINDDPLELEEFWPIPKPLFSITTSGEIIPVPFFFMYEDQANQLDDINERIYHLIDNMRRRGFYDKSIDELGNISGMGDNEFWPVQNWPEFVAKGGLSGAMQTEDITSFANILQILERSRQQLLEDIYQIIGISDIRRAQTDPRETLGAQKIKSRYGTIRISTYQRKVAEYMRDLIALTGEIIVKQFSPETIAIITHMPLQTVMAEDGKVEKLGVIDLLNDLRSKEPVDISIDVQTDSTIIEDEEEDRLALRESIQALAEFVQIAPALIQGIGVEATSKIAMEIISRFKLGRQIQQDVEDYIDKLISGGLPEKKDPAEEIAAAELRKEEIRASTDLTKSRIAAAVDMAKLQIAQAELALKARELGIDAEYNQEKINLEAIEKAIKLHGLEIEARSTENEVVGV